MLAHRSATSPPRRGRGVARWRSQKPSELTSHPHLSPSEGERSNHLAERDGSGEGVVSGPHPHRFNTATGCARNKVLADLVSCRRCSRNAEPVLLCRSLIQDMGVAL